MLRIVFGNNKQEKVLKFKKDVALYRLFMYFGRGISLKTN